MPAGAQDTEAAAPTSAAPTTDAAAEDTEALATARLHFANGVELLGADTPNYQDAYRQFELAYEKSGGNWKVLGNLGLCALKLERDGEALKFYQEYLEKGGEDIDAGERKSIERELLLLRGNMATVVLESSDPGARISVKRQGSAVPTQLYSFKDGKAALGIRSGSQTIIASLGSKKLEWNVVLSPGEEANHSFDFNAPPEGTVATSAPPADQAGAGPSGVRIAGYVTAGVGVLALGGGAVLGILSQSKASSAEDSCIGSICQESTEDEFESASSMATAANILFISGGVLAATGVTLIIVGGEKNGETDMSTAHIAISPAGGGLFATGRF